jgi:hypothetical protein
VSSGYIGTFRSAVGLYPTQERAFFVAFNSDPEDGRFDRVGGVLSDPPEPLAESARASISRDHGFAGYSHARHTQGRSRL